MMCSLAESQQRAIIRLEDKATLDFWLEFLLAPGMVQSVQRSTHAQLYQFAPAGSSMSRRGQHRIEERLASVCLHKRE